MTTVISHFFDALNKEEKKLIPRLADDHLGIELRCALSELDWYHYNISKTQAPSDDEQKGYYILQLGVTRLVYLALISRPSFDVPVVSFPRQPELSMVVLQAASALGIIQHGRRIAQCAAMGIGEISMDDRGEFNIKFPTKLMDNSGHEADVFERLVLESQQRFGSIMKTKPFQKLEKEVEEKLSELVYPWGTHFIGYNADPLLDDYFYGLAYHHMRLQDGFDSFHYALKFGGIRYQHYMLALTFVVSTYIRHEKFAEVLANKNQSTKLENVLTITSDITQFVKDLQTAVNYFGSAYEDFEELKMDDAKTVFNVLSCGRHSTDLVSAPGSPMPLIVQCSDQGFIRCLAGARSEPVRYLLEALRHHFPLDYDRNQCSREGSLQKAIKRILGKAFTHLNFQDNLKAKMAGKFLTDIDLVVIEKNTGIVLLCQLKHQDLYGFNLHAEKIRGERLVGQTQEWLIAVDRWLEEIGMDGLRNSLRLGNDVPTLQVHRLVISKHFAHQLREISSHQNTLYTNWPQLVLATEAASRNNSRRGLVDLVNLLQEIPKQQSTYEYKSEEKTKWCVGDLTFSTFQSE
ncbi:MULTISPECIES: hypothetical protein [Burkholderia cepacia complex]|uniref:hypothetical protein n=1 Tax=Burkholderia cepacia complex TaxID=87882 RepID=UPI0023DD7CB8|nr:MULTISPECIES: hypothetical protein [Burkholderia cepacia complex]MDF3089937.1 hypothetical protein [Burkholderia semiarida]MDF3103460.1 hypothetical protein [Burkholderia semiarida]WJN76505.1 hypothetical protein OH687_06545 [Burkholderia anthina]